MMRYRAPLRGHRYAMLSRCARLEPTRALTLPPRELQIQKEPHCCSSSFKMAVREGFEPSIRCRIHTFQACSFSHSDTSPFLNSYLGVSSSPVKPSRVLACWTSTGCTPWGANGALIYEKASLGSINFLLLRQLKRRLPKECAACAC